MKKIFLIIIIFISSVKMTTAQVDTAFMPSDGLWPLDAFGSLGYMFVAPVDFEMTKVFVPGNPNNLKNQHFAIIRVNGGSFSFNSNLSSGFTVLDWQNNINTNAYTPVDLQIFKNDTIVILALRGDNYLWGSVDAFEYVDLVDDSITIEGFKTRIYGTYSNSDVSSSSPSSFMVFNSNFVWTIVTHFEYRIRCPHLSATPSVTNASSSTSKDGSISVDLSDPNSSIRYLRWASKEGINYPSTNQEDVTGLAPGSYTLFLVTKENEPCYLGPVTVGP